MPTADSTAQATNNFESDTSSNQLEHGQYPNLPSNTVPLTNKAQAGNGGRRSWQPPKTISPK